MASSVGTPPPVALEAVAREAAELQVAAGDIIIREGARVTSPSPSPMDDST